MAFSVLCQLNNGCMGCCGNSFVEHRMKEAIDQNTAEFHNARPKTHQDFIAFRDRADSYDLRHGVCRNLIEEKGQFICPLHPSRHSKGQEDSRLGHCDIDHLCNTAKKFAAWHPKMQEEFISFIESKGLNNIQYSLQMERGLLMKEFWRKTSSVVLVEE